MQRDSTLGMSAVTEPSFIADLAKVMKTIKRAGNGVHLGRLDRYSGAAQAYIMLASEGLDMTVNRRRTRQQRYTNATRRGIRHAPIT